MRKRPAWTGAHAGFLPLVFSLIAALSLASCSWFTPVSGGTTRTGPGVLVTGQGFVTLLDRQTGKQIWRRQTPARVMRRKEYVEGVLWERGAATVNVSLVA